MESVFAMMNYFLVQMNVIFLILNILLSKNLLKIKSGNKKTGNIYNLIIVHNMILKTVTLVSIRMKSGNILFVNIPMLHNGFMINMSFLIII